MQEKPSLPIITIDCKVWSEESILFVRNYIEEMLQKDLEYEIIPAAMREIIITDEYLATYNKLAQDFGLTSQLQNESEYISSIKCCYNKHIDDREMTMLVHAGMFDGTSNPADSINNLMLQEVAEYTLPDTLKGKYSYDALGSSAEIAEVFFVDLYRSFYAQARLAPEGRENMQPRVSFKNMLAPFQRRVKWLHMKAQGDGDWGGLAAGYYEAMHRLFNHYLDNFLYNVDYAELKEFGPVLADLSAGVGKAVSDIFNSRPYDLSFMTGCMAEMNKLCYFNEVENGNVKIAGSPKEMFPGLVDTHQRIVGFVDILGFSGMIRNFDTEKDIRNLTDIKEVVEEAIEEMRRIFNSGQRDIDFRLFSDCLCVSLPYFDNDYDFTHAYTAIMLGIKTYQMKLLLKGFLVRGGIAIGQYYSDYNMIFSGALVDAYEFEKWGNSKKDQKNEYRPPRIIISQKIIEKLENTKITYSFYPFYTNCILKDTDDEYFLNPVFGTEASLAVYNHMLQAIKKDDNPLLNSLNELNSSLINSMINLLSPGSEDIMLTGMLIILNEAIAKLTDTKAISKYEWTKELIGEMKGGFVTGRFKVHAVNFKKIVYDWGSEEH